MEPKGHLVNLGLTSGVIGTQDFRNDGVEYVVKKLCFQIREQLSKDEWSKYEEQKTDSSRIKLFLETKEIQSCVQKYLKLHPGQKDKEKAMLLKNAGNKAFGSSSFWTALNLYTQCLAWMPHDGTKDVSLVYANRSAALFHLEEYKLSQRDAELAFHLNYPAELHFKLMQRIGECHQKNGDQDEAMKCFKSALKSLESSELDELKLKKAKRVLEELKKSHRNNNVYGFHHQQNQGGSAGNQVPALPDIVGGRNKYLRAASSKLTLEYREKQGRFLIANGPILPGDVILVEPAYVSILNPEQYHKQCFQCYAPLVAPIVCDQCIYASFCSRECQEKAKKHHRYECSILGLLKNSGISVICYMAVRILTQSDASTVLGWYDLAKKTDVEEISQGLEKVSMEQSNNCRDKTGTLETLGFNEEYRTDHVALFHLVTHSEKRRPEDFFHQIIMALYLLQALKATSYFDQFKTKRSSSSYSGSSDKTQEGAVSVSASGPSGESRCEKGLAKNENAKSPDEPTQTSISQNEPGCREDIPVEVEIKFAVLLLRCLKSLQFNTHETAGWDEEKEKENSVGLGAALFPTLALMNHSCNPAIVRYFINDTVVVRAVRTILPGEVVTENYGSNYAIVCRQDRKLQMLDYYAFTCDCIACKEDWPTFKDMTNEVMKFRCQCCRTFICKGNETMGVLYKCGKCGELVNVLKALKSLSETEAKYKKAVEFISNGQMETGLGMILENLTLLESILMPPFREYHMCQEHMRRCYLTLGNQMSKLPAWDPDTLNVERC